METLSLKKSIDESSQVAAVSLKKLGLSDTKANVILALDVSGSTYSMYMNRSVQDFVVRILGLAKNFHTSDKVPVYVFGDTASKIGVYDINNITSSKILEAYTKDYVGRSTNFTQLFNLIVEQHLKTNGTKVGKRLTKEVGFFTRIYHAIFNIKPEFEIVNSNSAECIPTYVVVMTDGQPSDEYDAIQALIKASYYPIFFQFVAISSDKISFLEKMDSDVKGRLIDNANVFYSKTPNFFPDDVLYKLLLQEYPSYLKEAKKINLI